LPSIFRNQTQYVIDTHPRSYAVFRVDGEWHSTARAVRAQGEAVEKSPDFRGLLRDLLFAGIAAALATGCGLAETTTTAAAVGASEVQQAKEAKTTLNQVKQRLDAAAKEDAQQHEAAEEQSQ
jgi:hypothetical protein